MCYCTPNIRMPVCNNPICIKMCGDRHPNQEFCILCANKIKKSPWYADNC